MTDETSTPAARAEASPADVPSRASATEHATPRIRAGAIAWGLIVSVVAVAVLAIVLRPGARTAFIEWMLGLTPLTIGLGALLALGGLVLLLAVLGLIRRAQRRSSGPSGAEPLSDLG